MKLNYTLANVCGSIYNGGTLAFTASDSLLSPIGSRLQLINLKKNTSSTLSLETSSNIAITSLHGSFLLVIDVDGHGYLLNVEKDVVLARMSFGKGVGAAQISPCGGMVAVADGSAVSVYSLPVKFGLFSFVKLKSWKLHYDSITAISWSPSGEYILTSSKDMTSRLYGVKNLNGLKEIDDTALAGKDNQATQLQENQQNADEKEIEEEESEEKEHVFNGAVLTGHKDSIIASFFHSSNIVSISSDGALLLYPLSSLIVYSSKSRAQKHIPLSRTYLNHGRISSATLDSSILAVGFNSGVFGIWTVELDGSICEVGIWSLGGRIDSVSIGAQGEWIAFGCAKRGVLMVWEWKSESYVLKQQGHMHEMTCLDYSHDSQFIATGGQDGKVKLWSTLSGFNFVTFSDHSGPITALAFARRKQILFSASLDGTVRAYDLIRYRNFKTYTSPLPEQFSCIAIDASAEIICAGSQDSFEVYMWSVQTGQLLEILSGHTGPISSLAFSPLTGHLASGSWDKTILVRDVFSRDSSPETMMHSTEVLALTFSSDGNTLASSTMAGTLCLWDVNQCTLQSEIACNRDIAPGRKAKDLITPKSGKFFSTICFSTDNSALICGGNSAMVNIYDITSQNLLKSFVITQNTSIDGIKTKLNSRDMTEAGPRSLIDTAAENEELEDRLDRSLPGVQTGDASLRTTRPSPRTSTVRFSPSGAAFACATTEGLFMYNLSSLHFDPFDLEMDITPATCRAASRSGDHLKALVLAFRLGEPALISSLFDAVPVSEIPHLMTSMPSKYISKLLVHLSHPSVRVGFVLQWTRMLMKYHASALREHHLIYDSLLVGVQKSLGKIVMENIGLMEYLGSMKHEDALE